MSHLPLPLPSLFRPLVFPARLRARMERAFDADFSMVELRESVAPLRLGTTAFAYGETVCFAPGAWQPGTRAGQEALGHELAHVLQQRAGRVGMRAGDDDPPVLVIDPALEDEAIRAGRQAARGERVDGCLGAGAGRGRRCRCRCMQPLVVNVGQPALHVEFRLWNGWIVAKDVYVALEDGGMWQEVVELGVDPTTLRELKPDENVYLQGHGRPGDLGVSSPQTVATFLSRLKYPKNYAGRIRAYCCSAGVGTSRVAPADTSGVAAVAGALSGRGKKAALNGVHVTGAAGVALNCNLYPNGTRVIASGQAGDAVYAEIDQTRAPVDAKWETWVRSELPPYFDTTRPHGGPCPPLSRQQIIEAAYAATAISQDFYMKLQRQASAGLIDSGRDLTTKSIVVPTT